MKAGTYRYKYLHITYISHSYEEIPFKLTPTYIECTKMSLIVVKKKKRKAYLN